MISGLAGLSAILMPGDALAIVRTLVIAGLPLFVISVFIGFSLAQSLMKPLIDMTAKVSKLKPKNWRYRKTVKTGDEIEVLDTVIADLTKRLQKAYERLEGTVETRTQQLNEEQVKDLAIIQSLSLGLLVLDPSGTVREANRAAMSLSLIHI